MLSAQHTTPRIALQGDRSDYLHGRWQLLLVPLSNTFNNFQGFVIFPLGYQPSWGFWKTPVKQCICVTLMVTQKQDDIGLVLNWLKQDSASLCKYVVSVQVPFCTSSLSAT